MLKALPGDTLIVHGFSNLLHQNCNTGKATYAFPADSLKFYKIMLKYQLSCPSFGCDIYDRIATLKVLNPTGRYDSTLVLAPSYTVNGSRPDTFSYMVDTSYSYSWNSTTLQIDSVGFPPLQLILFNDPVYPLLATDTIVVWPTYYNQYTFSGGVATDSVYVTPDQTLYLLYDSVYNIFEVKEPFEIARAITPYGMAVGLWFDVSDYRPILKDSVTLWSNVCGYSNGWFVTTDFYFIEGNPPANPYKVTNLWNGTWQYGKTSDPIDNHLQPITLIRDVQSVKEKVRLITTGHGFGGFPNQNVAEFYDVTHTLRINTTNLPQHLWRSDCGRNPLYPQGAPGYTSTWFYLRANWCPGSYVTPHDYDATSFASPGSSYSVDYNLQPYTVTGGPSGFYFPEYYIQSQVISYNRLEYANNAALLEVRRPNNAFEYNRSNPICAGYNPEVVIKNYGTNPLTSLSIHYSIDGIISNTFNWTGNLNFLDTQTVYLPPLNFVSGTHSFMAYVDQPNGSTDEFAFDDTLKTTFGTTLSYNTNFIRIMVKTDNSPNEVSWIVKDDAGNVVASRSSFAGSLTTYTDTVYLSNGCYNATAYDSGGDGLCCYNGSGFFRILKGSTATIIATKGDFGEFYSVPFSIDYINSIESFNDPAEQLFIYPNPSSGLITLNTSFESAKLNAQFMDVSGRQVGETIPVTINEHQATIDLSSMADGMYMLTLTNEKVKLVRRDRKSVV